MRTEVDRRRSTCSIGILVVLLGSIAAGPPARGQETLGPACALLINGGSEEHHVANVARAVRRLVAFGLAPSDVYVLSVGASPVPEIAIHYGSDPAGLEGIVDELGKGLGGRRLLVYCTGHGGAGMPGTPEDTSIVLGDASRLGSSRLRFLLGERVRPDRLVVVVDGCFSGGIVKTFESAPGFEIGVAPTDEAHITCCQPFAPLFWSRLAGIDPDSIRRAFREAVRGCDAHRRTGRCGHGESACSAYASRSVLREKPAPDVATLVSPAPDERARVEPPRPAAVRPPVVEESGPVAGPGPLPAPPEVRPSRRSVGAVLLIVGLASASGSGVFLAVAFGSRLRRQATRPRRTARPRSERPPVRAPAPVEEIAMDLFLRAPPPGAAMDRRSRRDSGAR